MAMMWPANQFDVDDLVDGIGDFIDGAARQLGEAAESYSNFLASAEQQLNHWVAETDSFLDGMAIELAMTAMDGMMWTAYKTVKITSQQSINEMVSDGPTLVFRTPDVAGPGGPRVWRMLVRSRTRIRHHLSGTTSDRAPGAPTGPGVATSALPPVARRWRPSRWGRRESWGVRSSSPAPRGS